MLCRVCGSDNTCRFISSAELAYRLCLRCGLLFHTQAIPDRFYEAEYRRRTHGTEEVNDRVLVEQEGRAAVLLPFIAPFLKPDSRVLDVGSSTGALLNALTGVRPIHTAGVEPGRAYAKYSRSLLTEVYPTLDDVVGTFDLLTCIHTLEHFECPGEELRKMHKLADDDALLVIEVPHAYWCLSALRLAHPCLFTQDSLAPLLAKTGWKVLLMLPWLGIQTTPYPENILALCQKDKSKTLRYTPADPERVKLEMALMNQMQRGVYV